MSYYADYAVSFIAWMTCSDFRMTASKLLLQFFPATVGLLQFFFDDF